MTFSYRTPLRLATVAGSLYLYALTAIAQMPTTNPQAQPSQTGMNNPNSPNTNNMGAVPPGATSPEDTVFVKNALEGGMAEVQFGQLALQMSNNLDVKAFAQKMVDDHTKMSDQMKAVAQQIGVKVPTEPSKKDRAVIAKLTALNGDDFDKAYMKDMVKDHKADLSDFQIEANNGSNPDVKNAASKGAQIISQHLQMAEQVNQKNSLMASGGSMK